MTRPLTQRALLAVALCVLTVGCPASEQPKIDEHDPLIQKLKAEQARLDRKNIPQPTELERAVTDQSAPTTLQAPASTVTSDGLTFTLRALEVSQSVHSNTMSLHTGDRFLKVTIGVMSASEHTLDLTGATLSRNAHHATLARDVQLVTGHPTVMKIEPNTGRDVVLYFEVPVADLEKGLKLMLPLAGAGVELAVQ